MIAKNSQKRYGSWSRSIIEVVQSGLLRLKKDLKSARLALIGDVLCARKLRSDQLTCLEKDKIVRKLGKRHIDCLCFEKIDRWFYNILSSNESWSKVVRVSCKQYSDKVALNHKVRLILGPAQSTGVSLYNFLIKWGNKWYARGLSLQILLFIESVTLTS